MHGAATGDARYRKAFALDAERRADEAAAILRALIAAEPGHVDGLALLGTIEAQADRFDAALPLLTRAAALRPGSGAIQNNLGKVFESIGQGAAALACYDRALALRPDHPRTLNNRARLLRRLGRELDAIADYERVVALEPDRAEAWADHAGLKAEVALRSGERDDIAAAIAAYRAARAHGADDAVVDHALAALGAAPVPPIAPPRYVRNLFDRYAERFDAHLRETLGYRGPELVVGAALAAGVAVPCDVLDLGCGTGLCGPGLRPLARTLVGVDLSAGMLARATARDCYDELEQGDLVAHLLAHAGCYDLAIAADVLNYIGDLAPFVTAARHALRPGALLAVSIERHAGDGYVLQSSRRYAHGAGYLTALGTAQGFVPVSVEHLSLRRELGAMADATVVVLRRGP